MLGAVKIWFTALSTTAKVGVVSAAMLTGGVASAAINSPTAPSTPPSSTYTPVTCSAIVTTPVSTQAIAFGKTTVVDASTPQGKTYIKTAGVNGIKTVTYELTTYTPTGCSIDTQVVKSEVVTAQPITEVTAIGSYVAPQLTCSNGSYVNVDGNTVCSPSSSSSGASARCGDGTYSYSQHRSGTCSHHGGVAVWY